MVRITTKVELVGPFFRGDPAQQLQRNISEMLEEAALEAAASIRAKMRASQGRRAPIRAIGPDARVVDFVRGRVVSLRGKRWRSYAVISPDRTGLNASQAIALYAAAAEIEKRTHVFARHKRAIRVAARRLTKGLN